MSDDDNNNENYGTRLLAHAIKIFQDLQAGHNIQYHVKGLGWCKGKAHDPWPILNALNLHGLGGARERPNPRTWYICKHCLQAFAGRPTAHRIIAKDGVEIRLCRNIMHDNDLNSVAALREHFHLSIEDVD